MRFSTVDIGTFPGCLGSKTPGLGNVLYQLFSSCLWPCQSLSCYCSRCGCSLCCQHHSPRQFCTIYLLARGSTRASSWAHHRRTLQTSHGVTMSLTLPGSLAPLPCESGPFLEPTTACGKSNVRLEYICKCYVGLLQPLISLPSHHKTQPSLRLAFVIMMVYHGNCRRQRIWTKASFISLPSSPRQYPNANSTPPAAPLKPWSSKRSTKHTRCKRGTHSDPQIDLPRSFMSVEQSSKSWHLLF